MTAERRNEKNAFKELGVEEYEICATLDSKTSDICREMDGKHFPMSEYKAGVTAPPFHPFCRSIVVPYSADGISDEDKALFEEYKKVLGELSPESLEEFLDIKYNEDAWNKLKSKYDILNQYEVDGNVSPEKIIQLDNAAFNTKRTGFDYSSFTGNAKKKIKNAMSNGGNAAAMEFEGNIYFSHSKFGGYDSLEHSIYIGQYPTVTLSQNRIFEVKDLGDGVPREYDTEAKFLEFAATKKQPSDTFEITILSEKHICQSCEGVVKQFKEMYPNATVNIVSGKRGYNGDEKGLKTWQHRKKVK